MKRKIFSTVIILLLVASIFISLPGLSAQDKEKPPEGPPPDWNQDWNGTMIFWDTEHNTTQDSWGWSSQAWEFGPYPSFAVYLMNGTEVTNDNFIPLGEPFKIVINVQKNIFTGNVTLGRAGLNWHMDIRSKNGTWAGFADCRMVYVNQIVTKYWNESDVWHVESFLFNESEVIYGPEKVGPKLTDQEVEEEPPPMEPRQNSFYIFDESLSNFTEFVQMWRIEIVGSFNETITPEGPFWTNLEITDSNDQWIDFGYSAWAGKNSPNRMIAVGKPGLNYGGYDETWSFEKLDMENNTVHSVSRGAPWKMRVNVKAQDLNNVSISFDLDWGLKTYVNVTGWYQKSITAYGGWMYNETAGTYYWNSSIPVTRTVEVYGPHLEERWISMESTMREVNVTREYWNETGRQLINTTEQIWNERMYLIYDHTTQQFSVKQGYSYWSYDPERGYEREYMVLEPLNTSNPATQFYNLSIPDCDWYQTGTNEYVIEFVGYFSNTTYSDREEYWIQEPRVFSGDHQVWANWEEIDPSDFQIAVDKFVAVTTILDSSGREVKGWMFQVDPGEFFIVKSKLYGANVKYRDIDGVGVIFRGGEGNWVSFNESYWSDVEVRLVKDLANNKLISETYNRTWRDIYTYGPHRGWELVNVTEWREEWNETTGEWEWVERPFIMWNETTVTDWHWEHQCLNQKEYALDPNSPEIWINREDVWIPDDDPAFRMPESYATLNSANISLIKGVVTAIINITFSPTAPQMRYGWDLTFKNLTYGVDWSQGWGEHTVTEWTSEQVYYLNSSATDYQAWYISRPSTPLYTVYNGTKYLLDETPYIVIDENQLPINVRTQFDWGMQTDVKQYLFWDQYDPQLGDNPRYYELLNGTKIYIQEGYQTLIRTLTLNDTKTYKIVGGTFVQIPNGTTFSTYMDHSEQDWSRQIWNETYGYWITPYYYALLNGTPIYRNEPFETQTYNFTTYRWELADPVYSENATSLMVNREGWGVALNQTIVVLLRDSGSWWQPLKEGDGYYLTMKNGTRIIFDGDPWSVPDEQRIVTINGKNYMISWPTEYYKAVYQGRTLMVPRGDGGQGFVRSFYYTEIGGVKYEMPYPGAMATSWWDLEGTESEGHKLKTFKSFTLNGTKYMLYPTENEKGCYILVDGTPVPVAWPMIDYGYYYALINGEEYWDVTQSGWLLQFGTYSDATGQITPAGSLTTTTGYDPMSKTWSENNRYGYDYENSTIYLLAPNGTRYDLYSGIYLTVWKVNISDNQYYTMDPWGQWEEVYDNNTGQIFYKNYILTLNGTKVYFDWERNPITSQEEIHIPVPGTNYTKLIPYTWQEQMVFDTLYIFNITIPALPWNASHTDVFYANGTEVPVGMNFKVYGTRRGPGTHGWYDEMGNLNNVWLPGVDAPWNESMHVGYFTSLDGNRIYSQYFFGWMDGRWSSEGEFPPRQWNYINDNPVAGNKTANAVEGGYCVYLNDTIKVDVTTEWPQGGEPAQYLVMKNGTVFNVRWTELGFYITNIGNQTYTFREVLTYYSVTDSGTVYNIIDPLDAWPEEILSPTRYLAPTIDPASSSWLWMNATSDAVLQDLSGYYLINASDSSRLSLELVSDWWNLPEKIRKDLFLETWELDQAYPRYNVTINGVEYFVIDPSPVTDRWDGEHEVEWNLYRYPDALNVTLGGVLYTIDLFEDGHWRYDIRWRRGDFITLHAQGETNMFEVEEQHRWKPAYQVSIGGNLTNIQMDEMNIYKTHTVWGEVHKWMLTDMNVYAVRSIWDIVVGTPDWDMWGIRAFDTVPETGAVDLDGDINTTDDQYFVRRLHGGADMWNQTIDRMWVELVWNPNSSTIGDEMHIGAWMGKVRTSWSFTWNETYIWYHASNMTTVSHETMQQINATLIDSTTGMPNAGYWEIAHMAKNTTWADLLEQAQREGWDWINDNKNEWEWIWFGTQQDYMTSWVQNNTAQTAGIGLRYEFAGLSLYNNTEQTHFFMPENVGNITFVTPGEAFGNLNATDEMIVSGNETVTFGVSYDDVNGTLFPFSEQRSMWGWWDGAIHGADFNVPNFMNRPTESVVDMMSLMVHFSANETGDHGLNNEASMKIDQRIGNWELDPNMIDGRTQNVSGVPAYLRGNDVLLNRSLAINYYVTAFTDIAWEVKDEMGAIVDNDNVTESEDFNVASALADANFASVRLGSTYDLNKPISVNDTDRTFNVTSKTSPIGSFRASFQSDAGKSSAGFDISGTMYFLTVGFPRWDGYAIYNDPEVATFIAKGMIPSPEQPEQPEDPEQPEQPEQPGILPVIEALTQPWTWIVIGAVAAGIAVAFVIFRMKKAKNAPVPTKVARKKVTGSAKKT